MERAMVLGGSGALGTAVCRALLTAGYETHATAGSQRSGDALRNDANLGGLRVHVADLTQDADTDELFKGVGPLAALVSTIGGFTMGPIAELTGEAIDAMVTLNIKTTLLGLKAAHPHLKASQNGATVALVGAKSALTGGAGVALYSATKAAVVNIALSAADEWKADGISVNAVLPSIFDTPANRQAMPAANFSLWPKPEEIADVAAFLVSKKGRIVSGGVIPVYGSS